MIKKALIFSVISLVFAGCTTKNTSYENTKKVSDTNEIVISYNNYKKLYGNEKDDNKEVDNQPIITPEEYKKLIKDTKKDSTSPDEMSEAFMEFYNEWKNVKYKFGGNSKKGIDCSAFTQRVYKEKFDISIPRSTRTQVRTGKKVKKTDLEIGDLIFFKTGKIDRHVGIYMGDGKFMHASIKGIKFTKLDKPFYKKTYWTSRRIID